MNTPVDFRRLGFVRNVSDHQGAAPWGQAHSLGIAARYLHLALDDEMSGDEGLSDDGLSDEGLSDEGLSDDGLSDEGLSDDSLSDDEELVYEALDEIPKEAQATPAATALSLYVSTAQTSGGKLTTEERQLIQELAACLKDHPQGDTPGLTGLLDLINDLVSNGDVDRDFTESELEAVRVLVTMVRSGDDGAPAVVQVLELARNLAKEGASLPGGPYSGLNAADVAEIKKRAGVDALPRATTRSIDTASAGPARQAAPSDEDRVALAQIEKSRAKLAPLIAQGDPEAIKADASLLAIQNRLLKTPADTAPDVRQQLKAQLGDAVDPARVDQLSDERVQGLLSCDGQVIRGLLGAGMSLVDVASNAAGVTAEEAKSPAFLQVLQDKIAAGVPAAEALVWARFSSMATPEELSDPDFIKALVNTPAQYSASAESHLDYARADLLTRRLDKAVSLEEVLKLERADVNALLKLQPEEIAALLKDGLDLKTIGGASEEQLKSLAKLDPEVVKALLGSGMKLTDVATCGPGVSPDEAKSADFIKVLKDKLSAGVSAADAMIWARFSPLASQEELGDPEFFKALKQQTSDKNTDSGSIKSQVYFARADLLVRRLDKAVTIEEVLQLSGDNINRLLTQDASLLKSLLAQGKSLKELSEFTPEQLAAFKSLSPDLLTWLQGLGGVTDAEIAKLTPDEIKILQEAKDAGFRRPERDTVVHDILPETVSKPIVLGEGLVTFKTKGGSQFIVTKAQNPGLYNQALGLITERAEKQVDEIRQKNGLPTGAQTDVMGLPSNVRVKSDDPNSANLTVGELSTKTLLDRLHGYQMKPGKATVENNQVVYRMNDGTELRVDKNQLKTDRAKHTLDMLMAGQSVSEEELKSLQSDEGSRVHFKGSWMNFAERVPDSSPRAQLARALEAKNALANGYDLLPYYEKVMKWGTYREYPGGEDNPTMQTMSSADVAAVLNEGEINNRVLSLMQDPTVQADYQSALSDSINSLPNKKELADQLFNALTGPAYIDALRALKDKNLCYEAEQMTQRDLSALAMLDPARGLEAAQQLRINSMGADFQALADDPSKIDVETFDAAMTDSMIIAAQVVRSTAGMVRHGSQSAMDISKFIEESLKDKKSVTELSKVVRELVIEMKKTGVPGDLGGLTQAQFEEAMAKTHVPMEMRGNLTGFFTKAQSFGVWGSISGAAAAAAFGYRLSQGAWGPDSTPLERWGAARDMLSFVSVGSHVAKAGAGSVDFVLNKLLGPGEDGNRAWKALGLDRTLPELWGKKSFVPSQQAAATDPLRQPLIAEAMDHATSDLWNSYDSPASRGSGGAPDSAGAKAAGAADNLGTIWAGKTELKPLGNVATRVGLTALKALSVVADVAAGVGDIVVSALGLKNAIKDGDAGMIAVNSVGIAGGTALTAAGGIGTAGLFGTLPAMLASAAAPLFAVGTVLALGGFLAMVILQTVRRHNQLQHASDQQGDWFGKLAKDGLAYGDWGDKLEYLRYSFSWYGNDNTDPNKSYFEFQQAEWDHFHNTPQKDGSSVNRLDSGLHVRTDKTWKTPEEEEEDEPDAITS